MLSLLRVWSKALSGKKNQNEKVERVEIYLKEAILTSEPLKDIFSFKEEIISLEKAELSSNLGSSSKKQSSFPGYLS